MTAKRSVWTIYCHTHTESGRRYIGLTSQTMERRWASHVAKSKSAKGGHWHFPNAILKYGPQAFSHEVLRQCSSLEEANTYEAYFIDLFRTRDSSNGFNLARGGAHAPHPIQNPWDRPGFREQHAEQIARFVAAGQSSEARARSKAALNTPESRVKRSAATKAVMARPDVREKRRAFQQDPEYRAKIGDSLKQTLSSPEARARMVAASVTSSTPEVRAERSASIRQALSDPEVRQRVSAASKAALADPVVKAKVVAGIRHTWSQPGYREKMSAIMRGKQHTPEAVERMREAYGNRPGVRVDKAALSELERLCREMPEQARTMIENAMVEGSGVVGAAQILGVHFLTVRKFSKRLGLTES